MNATAPTPRRTLSTARLDAIVEAALGLVVEIGFDRMTMDGIAARAGVGKATLYRWWPGKAELMIDALERRSRHERTDTDTGSLRGDLEHSLLELVALVRSEAAVLLGIGIALRAHGNLATALRGRIIAGERERLGLIVGRATERGERAAGVPVPGLAHEIAPALVFGRLLLTGDPLDEAFVGAVVDEVLLPVLTVQE